MNKHIYPILAAQRRRLGISQQELAKRAGLRREKVNRVESQGEDVGAQDLSRLLDAVGLRLSVHEKGEAAAPLPGDPRAKARMEARGKQRLYEEKLGRAHERIAAKLALGEIGPGALKRAREQVRKWHEHRICSKWYVDRWSRILEGPGPRVASKMLGLDGAEARALFQNTPFGFLVREQLRA